MWVERKRTRECRDYLEPATYPRRVDGCNGDFTPKACVHGPNEVSLTVMTSAKSPNTLLRLVLISCCLGFSAACQSAHNSSHVVEQSRITSPDGKLDAVFLQSFYGGALGGGVESDVYIVRKGVPVKMDSARRILQAEPFTGATLVWKQDHLLQIQYDIAHIEQFRNLWGLWEIENVGSAGEHDFEVEIRLAPLTGDFSLLTPGGSYRNSR
jgi:hypothetical protein